MVFDEYRGRVRFHRKATPEENVVTESERRRCSMEAAREGGGAGSRRRGKHMQSLVRDSKSCGGCRASGGSETCHSRKFITRNLMKFVLVTDK